MRNHALLLLLTLLFAGCSSMPSGGMIQSLLNATLPPDFTGNKHIDHQNPWVQFSGDFYNLRKDPVSGLWSWSGFKYAGHSAVTTTNVTDAPHESIASSSPNQK